jgi:hypothetical protein
MKISLYVSTLLAAGLVPGLALAKGTPVYVTNSNSCGNVSPIYSTIQAAVNAAGVNPVYVCPGVYPEQVIISRNLTLSGYSPSGSNSTQAIIVPPATGLVANTAYPGGGIAVAAQILVTANAGGVGPSVTISHLTVDGTGASGNGINGCAPDVVGIYIQNGTGSVTQNLVRNQVLNNAGLIGCQSGEGIFVENPGTSAASVAVTYNQVENFQKNGITALGDSGNSLSVNIAGNSITGVGPTTGAAENGIQVGPGLATAKVTRNTVADAVWVGEGYGASGILVYDTPGAQITDNTVVSTQFAVAVDGDGFYGPADGAAVSGNVLLTTHDWDAVDVCGAGSSTVTNNTINASDESAIHLDSECFEPSVGNNVYGNSINGACAGVLEGTGSGGTIGTNMFTNAAVNILTGTDTCSQTPKAPGRLGARRPVPKLTH